MRDSARRLGALLAACTLVGAARAEGLGACSDFDAHVNGRWLAGAELPDSRARVGSFDTLRIAADRLLESALAELVQEPARQTSPGLRLLASYYRSGMDVVSIEARGLAAQKPLLAQMAALTRDKLPALLGELARLQIAAPLTLAVGTDAKDATRHVLAVSQAGLGLPDRDDYFRDDDLARRIRKAYRDYARSLLAAAETPSDEATLDALMALEAEMARASPPRVERRDPIAQYNPMDAAALQARAPGIDWRALLAAYTGGGAGVEALPLVVGQPAFAQALARLAQHTPLEAWRAYLRLRLLDATAEHGPETLSQAHYEYYRVAIRGLKAPPSRSERVILAIGGSRGSAPMGEALGELYVARAFSPLAQARARQMFDDIRVAMRQRIAVLDWMSAPTRRLALAKLDAMVAKIGAPARWRSWDGLVLKADDYTGNLLRVNAWHTALRLADLGRPVDRERWFTSPHIVNAFAASGNQIVFPAAILQPPFFDAAADDASNYGGIGAVIGHEITHHFDDRGRQFDALGNLQDWWAPEDAAAYRVRAQRVAQLYSGYEPVPGVRINGELTLGENISDFGGLQIAYDGLQLALGRQRAAGKTPALVDGLTAEQRFFTANAIVWRSKMRIEALVDQLRTDSHSPTRWRVLAPMSHMPAFAQAFGCKAGDAMVAADPIRIW
ncbi:M13 family peptidase [Rubrivivax sp. A210]|uniref:M13 family metallopeptidase n=1 Tax=Rubrivivax sp. A210 TaxID=2772301 RepID=UPI001918FFF8|nr:M13 family metallopeptidase [Rubrivivax sp. A210]CAD5372431.1 M13 family peptidase [Rubrivivax sp. A210]